jgi:hypothetical protein
MSRLAAYVLLVGDMVRLWNSNQETFQTMVSELQQISAGAVADPYTRTGPCNFSDVLTEGMAFAVNETQEAEARRRSDEYFASYLEDKWIHKPVRSLGMVPPVDAAGHAILRKKLRGLIVFLADCAATFRTSYDFGRLRHRLGLDGAQQQSAAAPARDFAAMSAPDLAALDVAALSDGELETANQSALKLGAQEIAAKFASTLIARPASADRPDRYGVFNQLIQHALAEGQGDAALNLVDEGEKADCEHNEGRRRNDFELRRGQIQAKLGQIDQAAGVFERLIERAPAELRYRGSAAEAMLSARQPAHALRFAEGGLKKSREQNNRDSEQYFLELTAAAKKQGA